MKKVLVIRFNSIGDIVLSSPVIGSLSQAGYEVHYLVKAAFVEVLESNPFVTKFYVFESDLDEVLLQLKAEDYDLVIDLHNNIRSALVRTALKKPARILKKYRIRNWLMTNFGIFKFKRKHIVHRYMDVIAGLIDKEHEPVTSFYFPEDGYADTVDVPDEDYMCIAVGTAFKTKNIPIPILEELISHVDLPVILLGGKGEKDKADRLMNSGKAGKLRSYVGKISLSQSARVLKSSRLLVTGDTGLMHIAAALSVPTVSVYGSTHPLLGYTPFYGKKEISHYIIQNTEVSCRPCTKQGRMDCPKGHFSCMNELSVDEICSKVDSLLAN